MAYNDQKGRGGDQRTEGDLQEKLVQVNRVASRGAVGRWVAVDKPARVNCDGRADHGV